jgi:WD40 repeat protein
MTSTQIVDDGMETVEVLRLIVALCDRYEAGWRAGRRPVIEELLSEIGPDYPPAVLRELVAVEREHRQRADERPTLAEYLRRFPDRPDPVTAAFAFAPPPAVHHPPSEFGGYRLLARIGSGGMGTVYRAEQVTAGRLVAIKVIKPELLADLPDAAREEVTRRFVREARAAAALAHENIVTVYDVGVAAGCHYYSMRLIDGVSLAHRVRKFGPLPGREAAAVITTIARALAFAHAGGMIHRDLKPANVLIDARGVPYLADFGLVRLVGVAEGTTQSAGALGTPAYTSPEQATACPVTERSDVYGLGATLYEALTGQPPFAGDSAVEVLRKVADEPPKPLRESVPSVAPALEAVCLKCLAKNPKDRYATVIELADDLERYLAGQPIHGKNPQARERVRRQWRANRGRVLAGGLMAIVCTILIAFALNSRPVPPPARTAEEVAAGARAACKLCDEGNVAAGLFALGKWYRVVPSDAPELATGIRRTLAAWSGAIFTVAGIHHHPHPIRITQVSPDGRFVAVGDADGGVLLWDVKQAEIHSRYPGHTGEVTCLAFDPDGKKLAAGSYTGLVSVWPISSTPPPPVQKSLVMAVYGVALTTSGRLITGQQYDKAVTLRVWDAGTFEEVKTGPTPGPRCKVSRFVVSPDGRHLVVLTTDNKGELWDMDRFDRRCHLDPGSAAAILSSAAFTPDSSAVATGGDAIRVWAVGSPGPPAVELSDSQDVLGWTPDGGGIAVQSSIGGVRLWQRYGRCYDSVWTPRRCQIVSNVFTPTCRVVVENPRTMVVYRWPADSWVTLPLKMDAERSVSKAVIAPTGKLVALATMTSRTGQSATVESWVPFDGNRLTNLTREAEAVVGSLELESDNVLTSTAGSKVWRTDLRTKAREEFTPAHKEEAFIRPLVRNKRWVSWGYDDTVRLWDDPVRLVQTWQVRDLTSVAAVSPNERWLALRTGAGRLHGVAVIDLTAKDEAHTADLGVGLTKLSFTRDSRAMVGFGADRRIYTWYADTLQPMPVLSRVDSVTNTTEVRDGWWLTAHEDGSVSQWAAGAEGATWSWTPEVGHTVLGFDPTGVWLSTRSSEVGRVQFWDIEARLPIGPQLALAGKATEVQWGGDKVVVRSGKTVRAGKLPDPEVVPTDDQLVALTGMAADHLLTSDEWLRVLPIARPNR